MPLQKQILILSILLFFSVFSKAQKHSEVDHVTTSDSTKINYFSPNQIAITDSIINYGKLFLNTKYRRGTSGVNSFDCSGFTSFVYHNFGYNLERSSSKQAEQFSWVDRLKLKIGDLVFFSGRHRSKRVGHVGIVVDAKEDGKFKFIHASVQNGVIISSSDEPYYMKRFIKAGRVIPDNQMLAVVPNLSIPQNALTEAHSNYITAPFSSPSTQTKKIIPAEYHHVKKGETLSSIALKYGMTLAELKRKNNIKSNKINPKQRLKVKDAETVLLVEEVKPKVENKPELAENQVVSTAQSPKQEQTTDTDQPKVIHTVKKGETLFSISNLYNISIDKLKKLNNLLSYKIHFGQKIKLIQPLEASKPKNQVEIPETKTESNIASKPETKVKPLIHKVVKGESLYTIAKENNITVEDLKKINHLTDNKIRLGKELNLAQTAEPTSEPQKKASIKNENAPKILHHKVKSGESFYSIAEKFNCKVKDLKEWNRKTGSKLKTGEKLVIYKKAD